MTNINADTTDCTIAVRATASYYPNGAPPALCQRLLGVAESLDRLPEGGWPETVQGWRQAREMFDRLDISQVRRIVREARRMRRQRDQAQYQRSLSDAGKIARPFQAVVDSVFELSTAAKEYPDHDGYYVDVLRAALPDLTDEVIEAISRVCAHKVRAASR
jgi:hypothetical protein